MAVLGLVFFFVLSLPVSGEKIIIINETDEHFYSLESVLVKGDLAENALHLSGNGQVLSGQDVRVYLFGSPQDVLIEGLVVDGVSSRVSFDESGYFFIVSNGSFSFSANMLVRTPGQVNLRVPGPLNNLEFDIENGYPIGGPLYGLYDDTVVIQRSRKAQMLVSGAFKYSYAQRNSFVYQVDYKAYGQSLGRAELLLRNGESVFGVSGVKDHSVQGDRLVLELTGDSAHVVVSGTFSSSRLRIPLQEGRHHVLIESDPEKKIEVSTTAKELDLSESPLSPSYTNGRVFLASENDYFNVGVKNLETYDSLAASVKHASNRIAITGKGSVLGELTYQYANTGVDYIEIDAPGTPLYASTGNRPIKLTREENLLLSLPKSSSGSLDMIYFTSLEPLGIFEKIEVPVANTLLPVTQAVTQIYLPPDVWVLETLGARGGSELPSVQSVLVFIVLFGGLGYLMSGRQSFAGFYSIYSAALMSFDSRLFALSIVGSLILTLKRHVGRDSFRMMFTGAAGIIILVIIVGVFFGLVSQFGVFSMGSTRSVAMVESDYAVMEEMEAPRAMQKSMAVLGRGEGSISAPTRKGVLPVKLELPRLGKTITVTNHLVTKEDPVKLSVILVSSKLRYLVYLVGALCFLQCRRLYPQDGKQE